VPHGYDQAYIVFNITAVLMHVYLALREESLVCGTYYDVVKACMLHLNSFKCRLRNINEGLVPTVTGSFHQY